MEKPEFDSKTYMGRFLHYLFAVNPKDSFHSNARILKMKELLDKQREREERQLKATGSREVPMSPAEIAEIRHAQRVASVAIHPDTGEFIPWVMRLTSFIPVNIPISYGMIITAPTPFNTILWQFINQTYNAAMNYGNRNASSTYTKQDIAKSYSAACATSITVALGIRKILES